MYCTVEDDATVCPEAYLDYIGCLNHFAGCFGVEGETIGGDIGGNIGVPLYPPPGENGGATPATVCESNLDCEIEESESTCTISLCDLTENTCVIYPDHSQCAKGLCDPWEGCTSCTEDGDGDLFLNGVCGGSDCDDTSAAKNKLQAENSDADCADGEDNDCDGLVDENDSSCASLAQLQSCLSTADCFTGYCGPEGECLPCVTDANCDDGNPCTTDSCTDNGLFGGTCTYNSTSGITCTNSEDPCGTYMCEQGSPPTCELQDCLSGASGTNGVCMEDYTTQLYCEELGCTYSTAYYDYLTSLGTGDPTSDCTTQWCNKYQEVEAACGGSCSAEQQAFMQPMGWCDALPDAPEEGACSTNEDCEGLDACKVVECIAGTCSPTDFVADGTSCTGSVSCSTYTCQSGDCTGVNDPDDYNYCEPMSCTINQAYAEGLEASFTLDYSECVISWCDAQEQAYACFEPTVSLTVSQHEQCEEDFQNYSPYGADPGYLAEESFWTEEYGSWGWCPNQ